MAWNRLRGNWYKLKELVRGRWSNPAGAVQPIDVNQRRRRELVNRIEQLARDEARRGASSPVQEPGSRHWTRVDNRKGLRS